MDDTAQRKFLALVVKDIRFYAGHLQVEYRFPRNMAGETLGKINLPKPATPGPKGSNRKAVKPIG